MKKDSEPLDAYILIDTISWVGTIDSAASYTDFKWKVSFRTDVILIGSQHYRLHHLGSIPTEIDCPTKLPAYIQLLKEQFKWEVLAHLSINKSLFNIHWVVVASKDPHANGLKPPFKPPVYTCLED